MEVFGRTVDAEKHARRAAMAMGTRWAAAYLLGTAAFLCMFFLVLSRNIGTAPRFYIACRNWGN